jgi:hypothetical protein
MHKTSVILLNGDFPTARSKSKFIEKAIAQSPIKPVPGTQRVVAIENVKFSSKLAYKFDYDNH